MSNLDNLKSELASYFSRVDDLSAVDGDSMVVQYEMLRWCGPHMTVTENAKLMQNICRSEGFSAEPLDAETQRNWRITPVSP